MSMRSIRSSAVRLALVGAGVALSLVSGAATASASYRGDGVGCRVNDRIMYITLEPGAEVLVARTAAGQLRTNGQACSGLGGPAADVWNTKSVRITGDTGSEKVTLDLSHGGFAPGYGNEAGTTDEMEFRIFLGQGWDQLKIAGTGSADHIAFGAQSGGWISAPAINLNDDGDLDVLYQSADFVIAWGYGGNDTIVGTDPTTGTAFLPVHITGGDGNDTLAGGSAGDTLWGDAGNDTVKGGKGDDELYTKDGVGGNDTANGGAGTDTCHSDLGDPRSSCEQG